MSISVWWMFRKAFVGMQVSRSTGRSGGKCQYLSVVVVVALC